MFGARGSLTRLCLSGAFASSRLTKITLIYIVKCAHAHLAATLVIFLWSFVFLNIHTFFLFMYILIYIILQFAWNKRCFFSFIYNLGRIAFPTLHAFECKLNDFTPIIIIYSFVRVTRMRLHFPVFHAARVQIVRRCLVRCGKRRTSEGCWKNSDYTNIQSSLESVQNKTYIRSGRRRCCLVRCVRAYTFYIYIHT